MTTSAAEPTMVEKLLQRASADIQAYRFALELEDNGRSDELQALIVASVEELEGLLFIPQATKGAYELSDVVMTGLRNFMLLVAHDAKDLLPEEEVARFKAQYDEVSRWQKMLRDDKARRELADSVRSTDS